MFPTPIIFGGLGLLALAFLRNKREPTAATGWYGSDYTQYGYPGYRGGQGPGPGFGPYGGYGSPGYSELGYGHGYYINRNAMVGAVPTGPAPTDGYGGYGYGSYGYGPYVGAAPAAPGQMMADAFQAVRNLAATYMGNLQASTDYPGPAKDNLVHQLSIIAASSSGPDDIRAALGAIRKAGQGSLADDLQAVMPH